MALFPLQAAFRGDFCVLVVPVDDQDDMNAIAEKVAHHAIGLRVAPQEKPKRVFYNGEALAGDLILAKSGIGPMDYVEVAYV